MAAQRQALTVALLGVAFVALGTLVLLALTDFELADVLFEVISAFAHGRLVDRHHAATCRHRPGSASSC